MNNKLREVLIRAIVESPLDGIENMFANDLADALLGRLLVNLKSSGLAVVPVDALEPFGHEDLCKPTTGMHRDEDILHQRDRAVLKLGDFRRIRAMLKAAEVE